MNERESTNTHLALYRKYRSRSLDEIIGQPQVTDILKAVTASGNFAHAYLFTGQRGTGKTSVARILAHLINGTEYGATDIDIIEIDAASNNGVDDVRELRDNINLAPMHSPRKIYIIDEVHMLSTAAFNALLKTIEEPPAHVVFILATTEIQKMPATILSRVQRFHFRPVSTEIVARHLRNIADQENIEVDDDALNLITERGGGSFRDSITLLDQLSGNSEKITRDTVEEILGLAPESAICDLIEAVQNHDVAGVIGKLNQLQNDGASTSIITEQLIAKLSSVAIEQPRLFSLVEKLLDVAKSAAPNIKLAAILAQAASSNTQNSNDTRSPILSQAPVLNNPAPKQPPEVKIIEKVTISETKTEVVQQPAPSIVSEPAPEYKKIDDIDQENTAPETAPTKSPEKPATTSTTSVISWSDVLNEVRSMNAPAVLATLNQASFDWANSELTLYFDKAFHRKNAEKPNFRDTLNEAFQTLYKTSPQITIAKTAKSATDSDNSDIAKIAAIMGGGEIVKGTEV
ncbi:MAG: DNA polymerase III subunit gamma/tau [Candidatus Nomurabacteria bacterium]|jgi:DNA polymerase-3 subunit gamma/tau|nr:DNA polymerase III subunit gamma/tau [Candidatus Nomurabacteria bacterium]